VVLPGPVPFEAERVKAERKLRLALQKALSSIQKIILRNLRREARESIKGLLADAKAISDVPNDPRVWDEAKGKFFDEVGGQTDDLLLEGAAQAERLGLAIDFELVNQQVLDYAGTFKNEWWTRLAGTTQNGMRRAIQTNIATGAPLRSLERSLEPLFGKTRAQVIASTETTRMYAEGNKIAYKSAGVGEVEFQTVRDSLVDSDCEKLHGKKFPIDSAPTPPIHPRCRCFLAPITDTGEVLRQPVGEEYSEFSSQEGAAEFAERNFRPAGEVYTPKEISTLGSYKLDGYRAVNAQLRGSKPFTAEGSRTVSAMDRVMAKQTLKENVTAWRGVDTGVLDFEALTAGQGFSDAAFLSTTLDKSVTHIFGRTIIKIRVPKGTKGIWMQDGKILQKAGFRPDNLEAELLLSRNLRLRVVDKWLADIQTGARLPPGVTIGQGGWQAQQVVLMEVA